MSKTKSDNNTFSSGNIILIAISYHVILIILYSVFLGGFELGDEFLDVFGVNGNFVECRSDEDYIFNNKH